MSHTGTLKYEELGPAVATWKEMMMDPAHRHEEEPLDKVTGAPKKEFYPHKKARNSSSNCSVQ